MRQVRLTDIEIEELRKKSIEINNVLLKNGKRLLDDPKLIHKILEKAIRNTKITNSGEIYIEDDR